jgi:hypothetical protein
LMAIEDESDKAAALQPAVVTSVVVAVDSDNEAAELGEGSPSFSMLAFRSFRS